MNWSARPKRSGNESISTDRSNRGIPNDMSYRGISSRETSAVTSKTSTKMAPESDRMASAALLSHDTTPQGSEVDQEHYVITQQPRGAGLNPAFSPRRDVSQRPESEEQLMECLNCALIVVFCPCLALSMPFTCPRDYERVVIFRLGKLRRGGARGPGIVFINPCLDEFKTVDMRIETVDVFPQEILTKDGAMIRVDAVIFYRVLDAVSGCCDVMDFRWATVRMSEGTLRSVLAQYTLSDLLEKKSEVSAHLKETLDEATNNWGVTVVALEIKNMNLPLEMIRAMSTEAQTEKQALGNVVLAEGEEHAAEYLSKASACLTDRSAVTLRSLETLVNIAQKPKSLTVFPFPMPEGYWLWGDAIKDKMVNFTDVWGMKLED